jgi:hypothetical protein
VGGKKVDTGVNCPLGKVTETGTPATGWVVVAAVLKKGCWANMTHLHSTLCGEEGHGVFFGYDNEMEGILVVK